MSYVFGPVPSRRLGMSLGVDLLPFKTCTFNCIYCQLGCTTRLLMERREWVPVRTILDELEAKLDRQPDYITIGGGGEPSLYAPLGELIDAIKQRTQIPVAVLTNGSLFWWPEVRRDMQHADLVSPSLDAGDVETFRTVNRPHPEFPFERMIDGLAAFRDEFCGQYWLEVLVLDGITSTREQILKIAALAARIRPDRIQLNTATRPPAEERARGVSQERLEELAQLFHPPAEVIADFPYATHRVARMGSETEVLDLITRHPSSVNDIAAGLSISQLRAEQFVAALLKSERIEPVHISGVIYYRAR